MKTQLLALMLLLVGQLFSADISIGIRIGPPPPPRVVYAVPPSPGPGFLWVREYWYPVGQRYKWHEGYWTRAPYAGARWVPPHHDGERFFTRYWEGDRGRREHDHYWDRDHGRRDFDRGRDRDHH